MLVMSRKKNESIVISDEIVLTVIEIRGDKVRLGITCPRSVPVYRQETFVALQACAVPEPPPRSAEEMAFLQAVLESPDDEGIRLIFADWLDEHGDPRGEFIRVQCRRAKLASTAPDYKDLAVRERILWERHGKDWRAYLPAILRSTVWERGFVERVHLTVDEFLTHAADIFAAAPVRYLRVRRTWMDPTRGSMAALASSPYLSRLRGLDWRDQDLGDDEAHLLIASPHTAALEWLALTAFRMGRFAAQALRNHFGHRVLLEGYDEARH